MSATSILNDNRYASVGPYSRRMSIIPKPSLNIHIENHYRSKTYTTSSPVSGYITITPPHDVRFDAIQILLLGTSRTRVDAVVIPQATSHTFLKLIMPIPESSYPSPRILEAGRAFKVPFHFIIPQHLTLNACNHNVCNDDVHDHHLRLPPSIGGWERDDMAPHMSRVTYSVKARVVRNEDVDGLPVKLMEAGQEIKVLPVVPEDAPLNITKFDKLYTMSKSKALRKSILSSKTGKVTVSASQPSAAMLSPDGVTATPSTLKLDLQFEPTSGNSQPPKVTSISTKVTAVSYFSASGINHYPNLREWNKSFGGEGRGAYSTSVSISSKSIDGVHWRQQPAPPLVSQTRRDSGYGKDECSSSSSSDEHSDQRGSSPTSAVMPKKRKVEATAPRYYHSATLQIPVELPLKKKIFVPTFHSCIASRVYILSVAVNFSSSTLTLAVPLQVGVSAPPGEAVPGEIGLPSFEAAMGIRDQDEALVEESEVEAYLRPRVLGVPDVTFDRSGMTTGLPGYEKAVAARNVVAH
ncbi:hypothetical protein F4778DRAFT_245385 [Xylariomycetidae sp. FL2044]|nr:hypothetical protein F4778DRAFT_245385 [Xylariomycetidae sp. FL2044]